MIGFSQCTRLFLSKAGWRQPPAYRGGDKDDDDDDNDDDRCSQEQLLQPSRKVFLHPDLLWANLGFSSASCPL